MRCGSVTGAPIGLFPLLSGTIALYILITSPSCVCTACTMSSPSSAADLSVCHLSSLVHPSIQVHHDAGCVWLCTVCDYLHSAQAVQAVSVELHRRSHLEQQCGT